MKVKALRGVCAGAGRNLQTGDLADLDPGTAKFLASIGAVEFVKDEPAEKDPPPAKEKPAAPKASQKSTPKSEPDKSGKQEK